MSSRPTTKRRALLLWVGACCAIVGPGTPTGAQAQAALELPAHVLQALQRAQVPPEAVGVVVQSPTGAHDRLRWNAQQPMNPASVVKLVTTFAALESLGPSWTWSTPVWLNGPIENPGAEGVLNGHLHLKGSGDPSLTQERIEALLQHVRGLGVREIRGDIVLDQSRFAAPPTSPGEFDGESLRPYNVQARALMLNQRTIIYRFVPDAPRGVARVVAEPELHGVRVDPTVPLISGPCVDWRRQLKGQFTDPGRVRWAGGYPAACGAQQWPVAHPDPAGYDARLLQALWLRLGGTLTGRVREGAAPVMPPTFEWRSPPLAEVVRDINRFSNNTMAQLLALTWTGEQAAAIPAGRPVVAGLTAEQAREALQRWAQSRLGGTGLRMENGSGLSREQRLSAEQVATLLRQAWASPVRSDLMDSLPVAGAADGTLRRLQPGAGRAHLKTGSLRDVAAVAGYVLGRSEQPWIVVVLIHHEKAASARPALEALVQWAIQDEAPASIRTSRRPGQP